MENKFIDVPITDNGKMSFLKSGNKVCFSILTDTKFVVNGFAGVVIDLEKDFSSESKDLFVKFLESLYKEN